MFIACYYLFGGLHYALILRDTSLPVFKNIIGGSYDSMYYVAGGVWLVHCQCWPGFEALGVPDNGVGVNNILCP